MRIFCKIVFIVFLLQMMVYSQQEKPSDLLEHSPQILYDDKPSTAPIDEDELFFEKEVNIDDFSEKTITDKNDLIPPLSIDDTLNILNYCAKLFSDGSSNDKEFQDNLKLADSIVDSVIGYVEMLDQKYESLLYYKWTFIGKEKVSDKNDIDSFIFAKPLTKINAISFIASRNLIFIHHIKITNVNNETTKYEINKWISNTLPGKQVCFLPVRQDINKIEIMCDPKLPIETFKPRILLYGGESIHREYTKLAIYYLRLAKMDIKDKNPDDIITNVGNARSSLKKFKNKKEL